MTVAILDWKTPTVLCVPRTGQPTAPPSSTDEGIDSRELGMVRALVRYYGTVTRCVLRLWLYDPHFTAWYVGASTDDLDPLAPAGVPIDAPEGRDWMVGIAQQFTFQVEALEGTGEVEVWVSGVKGRR